MCNTTTYYTTCIRHPSLRSYFLIDNLTQPAACNCLSAKQCVVELVLYFYADMHLKNKQEEGLVNQTAVFATRVIWKSISTNENEEGVCVS